MSFITQDIDENCQKSKEKTISICWHNLTVKVGRSVKLPLVKSFSKKSILQSINGHFTTGSLNGLLGPSGAGKTTLLNVLSGSTVNFCGNLQYGTPFQQTLKNDEKSLLPVSYYIRQHLHDCIVTELTVGQLLHYAYCFKNDVIGNGENNDAKKHIEATMSALSLPKDLLNRPFKKCSGGEQKRVAIAQELMSLDPPTYLFLDEPTTGLDSVSAYEVITCLKGLVVSHPQMTIVASIHAPNDETLNLFDQLYVLAKGGVPVYEGPPDGIRTTIEKVTSLQIHFGEPPIEALLKVACNGPSDSNVNNLAKHQKGQFCEWAKLKEKTFLTSQSLKSHKTFCFSNFITHFFRQFCITFSAQLPFLLFLPLFLTIFFAILCTIFDSKMATANDCYPTEKMLNNMTAYSNGTCNSEEKLKEEGLFKQNAHYLSYVLLLIYLFSTLVCTVVYSKTLKVFAAEHQNRWYSLGVFFTSNSLVSLLEITLTTIFVAAFSYLLSGQHITDYVEGDPSTSVFTYFNWTRFALYVLFILLVAIYSQTIGHFLAAACAQWPIGVALISYDMVGMSLSLFNGLNVKMERMRGEDSGDPMVILEQMIGLAGLSRGLMYSIYGFEKCKNEHYYSWILKEFNVHPELILEYVWKALINVIFLKVVTLVVLWWQFSSWEKHKQADQIKKEKIKVVETKNSEPRHNENLNLLTLFVSKNLKNERESIIHKNEKILLAWHNLSLFQSSSFIFDNASHTMSKFTNQTQQEKHEASLILRRLDGAVRFNSLTALMGTSGAGKTSLLRVLNGQCKTRLSPETEFYLSTLTPINTCFIAQEVSGHLLNGITAFQTLRYASMLRNTDLTLPKSTDKTVKQNQPKLKINCDQEMKPEVKLETEPVLDHNSIARRWLSELGLKDAADTRVEALSGGEAKRLAVAIELTSLSMPHLLCIDEPTSGLDSSSAKIVVRALRRLTNVHPLLTIITSVHQPTAEVLTLFDTLYVLARGGVAIYSGKPEAIQDTLDAVPIQEPLSLTSKSPFPIENLIKQSCLSFENPFNQELETLTRAQFFKSSAFLKEITEQTVLFPDGVPTNQVRFKVASVQTLVLRYLAYVRGHLWKEWLFFTLSTTGFAASLRFFFPSNIATYNGCLNIEEEDTSACALKTAFKLEEEFALKDNLTYGYFFTIFYQMLVLLLSSRVFLTDFNLFENEHRNGAYSTGAWYLVQSIAEMTPHIPGILIFAAVVDIYEPSVSFYMYPHIVILTILGVLAMIAFGHTISLLSGRSLPVQTVLLMALFFFSLLIGNYIIPVADMHYFWQWVANFSIPRYLLEALMALQYGYGRCAKKEEVPSVLYSMSINKEDAQSVYGHSLFMIMIIALLFRLTAFWLLVQKANPIQNRKRRIERLATYHKETLATNIMVTQNV